MEQPGGFGKLWPRNGSASGHYGSVKSLDGNIGTAALLRNQNQNQNYSESWSWRWIRANRRHLFVVAAIFVILMAVAVLANSGGRTEAEADDVVANIAACVDYDDDTVFPSTGEDCVEYDENFCEGVDQYLTSVSDDRVVSAFASGTKINELCESACTGSVSSGMVCIWQAVANLASVCDGTYEYNSSNVLGSSENHANVPNRSATSLYACDEHAVCLACGQGSTSCDAVISYYGGFSWQSKDAYPRSALNAIEVLNDDLDYWCSRFG